MSVRNAWLVLAMIALVSAWVQRSTAAGPSDWAERLRFDPAKEAWEALPKPQPGTPEGDLMIGGSLFAEGRYRAARQAAKQWQKRYGEGPVLYPASLLLLARSQKALRNYHVAHEILTEFLTAYRGTVYVDEALTEEFNIAEVFLSGVRRKLWGMRLIKADDTALDILDRISTDYSGTRIAERATKTKADYFFNRGDFGLAEMEYGRLLRDYPHSQYRRYAMRQTAEAALADFGGVAFDDAPLIEAEERFKLYLGEYPGLAEQEGVGLTLQSIRERRALKEFEIGRYYQRAKKAKAAAFYFRSASANWPETIAATRAASALSAMGESGRAGDVEMQEVGVDG